MKLNVSLITIIMITALVFTVCNRGSSTTAEQQQTSEAVFADTEENFIAGSDASELPAVYYREEETTAAKLTSVPEELVNRIYKRFEAIENGDIAAFRATLPERQDGVDYYYQLGLLVTYFGDFIGINYDAFHDAVSDGGEELTKIANALFYGEHSPRSRNTGLIVQKVDFCPDDNKLRAIVKNSKNEESIHYFIYN